MAVVAGLLLAVQVGLGQNSAGVDFALPAFTACFLGGAALAGGAGSFIGALLGALFLSTLTNVIPLLGLPDAMNGVFTGGLTILAVVIYTLTRGAPPALTRRWPFLQKLTTGTRGSLPGSPAASNAPASNAAEKVTGPGA
jgi:ribose transport system ATP-binding protein